MAPIKFEDDFKNKLDKRTIAPSKGAWDTLSKRLEAEEKTKNNNKNLWWIGTAASVIGILFAIFQFSNTKVEINTPTVVDTSKPIQGYEKKQTAEDIKIVAPETTVAVEAIKQEYQKLKTSNSRANAKAILNTTEVPKQIANTNKVSKFKLKEEIFETEKAQEVADAIYTLSETKSGVSDASIDSLLKAAQRDILLSRMKNEDKVLVDASLLLQEVEFELDQSFRNKVFKALKESYGSVKTAIAQRND